MLEGIRQCGKILFFMFGFWFHLFLQKTLKIKKTQKTSTTLKGGPTAASQVCEIANDQSSLHSKLDDLIHWISTLECHSATTPHSSPQPGPRMKLDVRRFDRTNVVSWIFKISQFFLLPWYSRRRSSSNGCVLPWRPCSQLVLVVIS